MNKTLIAIINKDRDLDQVKIGFKELFDRPKDESTEIWVLSNDEQERILHDNVKFISKQGFTNVSQVNNCILDEARFAGFRYVHIMHDDIQISPSWNASKYEEFMNAMNLGYYFDPKLSPMNYIYDKLSPRLIIHTEKHYSSDVSVFAFDCPDYCVIDLEKNNLKFDENVEFLYNIEYINRCKKEGLLPFLNFYLDSVTFMGDIKRNALFPKKQKQDNWFFKDQVYMQDTLKLEWVADSNIDFVIEYFKKVVKV